MEFAEYQHLVRIGHTGLINKNIRQTAHDPFMGTRYAADMSHAWKFCQLFGSQTDAANHLRGCDRISTLDVAVNCGNVFPRLRGEA